MRARTRSTAFFVLIALAVFVAVSSSQAGQSQSTVSAASIVTLNVDASVEVAPFDDRVRGVATNNWNWLWEGLWDRPSIPAGKTEAIFDVTSRIEPGIIRFAGGLWVNEVGWDRDNQRGGIDDGAWTWVDPDSGQQFNYDHAYSPEMVDAFQLFRSQVGPDGGSAQAMIQVNICDNNIAMWEDLVRYSNIENVYGFEYWELGNEQTLDDCGLDATTYAQRYAQYQTALKLVDPTIKLLGPVSHQPTFSDWDDALIAEVGTDLDALAWHWYQLTEWNSDPAAFEFQGGSVDALLAWGGNVGTVPQFGFGAPGDINSIADGDLSSWTYRRGMAEQRMAAVSDDYISTGLVDPNIETALTELSPLATVHDHPINSGHLAAIWLADTLPRWAYNGLDIATFYSLEDGSVGPNPNNARGFFGGVNDSVLDIRPTYHTAWLLAQRFGDTLVQSSTSDPNQNVVVWASTDSDGGKLKLMLVNLTANEVAANIQVAGFSPQSGEAYELTSADPMGEGNDLDSSDTAYFNEHTTAINGITIPDYQISDPSAFNDAIATIESTPRLINASDDFFYPISPYSVVALELSSDPVVAPPLVIDTYPYGQLGSGITEVEINAVTDVASTCRYSTDLGTPYESMTDQFDLTGGIVHRDLVTGLLPGVLYQFWVRCTDESGTTATTDRLVSFDIAGSNLVIVEKQIEQSADDAFHVPTGWPGYSSGSGALYFGKPGSSGPAWSGARWDGLDIPAGSTILNAYVEFTQDGWGASQVSTEVALEDAGAPSSFSSTSSPRDRWATRTQFEFQWDWTRGAPGSTHQTPSLTDGIQELVDRYGGITGLALVQDGSIAESQGTWNSWRTFDSSPQESPKLVVEYNSTADIFPPLLSEGGPDGDLDVGATQATLTVTTDENAVCRYGTVPGAEFQFIPDSFSTTGLTSHSVLISGLNSGDRNDFYVRCADTSGNASDGDYRISFQAPIFSNAPVFESVGPFVVDENSPIGTVVGSVSATDADLDDLIFGEAATLLGANEFDIDPDTGVITVDDNTLLDRELFESLEFAVQVTDGINVTSEIVTVELSGVNDNLPLALPQSVGTSVDAALPITILGFDGDIDPIEPLAFSIVSGPSKGTVSDPISTSPNSASLTYTPNAGYDGTDQIGFIVGDGINASAPALVNITVSNLIPPSVVSSSPEGSLAAGQSSTEVNILTDELAVCRYSEISGTDFESMVEEFDVTGSLLHRVVFSDLPSSSTVVLFVRCGDPNGNTMQADHVVTFTTVPFDLQTIDVTIDSSADDAHSVPSGWPGFSSTSSTAYFGRPGASGPAWTGFRWDGLDIPDGAQIVDAYVVLTQTDWAQSPTTTLALENSADPQPFSSASAPDDRWGNRTGFEVTWDWSRTSPGSSHQTPSLADGIQEIVDTHGGIDGLVLIQDGTPAAGQGTWNTWATFDGGAANAPRLVVTYAAGDDIDPPILSDGEPTERIPSSQTSLTLSLQTDEISSCRYSLAQDFEYDLMVEVFETLDGLTHSVLLDGLTSGTNYMFYARCSDQSGNANAADYPIGFRVVDPGESVPDLPTLVSPGDGETGVPTTVTLHVTVNHPDEELMDAEFYGRQVGDPTFSVLWSASGVTSGSSLVTSWTGLAFDESYEWYVQLTDSTSDVVATPYFSFTVQTEFPDLVPPTLTDFSLHPGIDHVVVRWNSDEPTTSVIRYGETPDVLSSSVIDINDSNSGRSYASGITGLAPGTTHYLQIESSDSSGNVTMFPVAPIEFSTLPSGTTPTIVSSPYWPEKADLAVDEAFEFTLRDGSTRTITLLDYSIEIPRHKVTATVQVDGPAGVQTHTLQVAHAGTPVVIDGVRIYGYTWKEADDFGFEVVGRQGGFPLTEGKDVGFAISDAAYPMFPGVSDFEYPTETTFNEGAFLQTWLDPDGWAHSGYDYGVNSNQWVTAIFDGYVWNSVPESPTGQGLLWITETNDKFGIDQACWVITHVRGGSLTVLDGTYVEADTPLGLIYGVPPTQHAHMGSCNSFDFGSWLFAAEVWNANHEDDYPAPRHWLGLGSVDGDLDTDLIASNESAGIPVTLTPRIGDSEVSGPEEWIYADSFANSVVRVGEVLSDSPYSGYSDRNLANQVGYLATYIYSPVDQTSGDAVHLKFGASRGARVWLNGSLLHDEVEARYDTYNQSEEPTLEIDKYDYSLPLRAGWNTLIIKSDHGSRAGTLWAVSPKIGDENGNRIPDLIFSTRAINLDVTASDSDSISIDWQALDLTGAFVDSYRLDVATDSEFTQFVIDDLDVGLSTDYVVGGLTPGQRYFIRIRPFNSTDMGGESYWQFHDVVARGTTVDAAHSSPGEFDDDLAPMFVLLGSDDNNRAGGMEFFVDALTGRFNPDGSPALMSFYLIGTNIFGPNIDSQEWRDQYMAAYNAGHEIGNHGFFGLIADAPSSTVDEWLNNWMVPTHEALILMGIDPDDIRGFRAPQDAVNPAMYQALELMGYEYGNSSATNHSTNLPAWWPGTLENGWPGGATWDSRQFGSAPGIWEIPQTYATGTSTYCDKDWFDQGLTGADWLADMKATFQDLYEGNRAPLSICLHSQDWGPNNILSSGGDLEMTPGLIERQQAMNDLLDWLLSGQFPEVRVTSHSELIDWMRQPTEADDPPEFDDEYEFDITENSSAGTTVGTVSASDPDLFPVDTLTFSEVSGGSGESSFEIDSVTGEITVESPDLIDRELAPSLSYEIEVTDETYVVTSTVTVTIIGVDDNSPIFDVTGPFSVDENALAGTSVGTVNATDADVGPIDILTYSEAPGGAGESVFSIDSLTGEITVQDGSTLDRETIDSVLYEIQVTDETTSVPLTVTVDIDGINDNSPSANSSSESVDEDATLTIILSGSDADIDPEEQLEFAIESGPSNGLLSPITVTSNTTAEVSYTPDLNYNGADSFAFTVFDGSTFSAAATVNITVNPINDVPTAVADDYTTDEDVALVIAAPGVLDNDSDLDGDALTVTGNTDPSNGSVTVNADGSFTYTPDPDFNGPDSFTYNASDGIETVTATVNITVDPINDLPVADAGLDQTVTIGDNVVLDGSASSDPVEGDLISYAWSIISAPVGSAAALNNADTVNPDFDPDLVGAYTVQLVVNDGTDDSVADTVEITVEDLPNTAPTAVDDDYTTDEDSALVVAVPGVLENDSDIDGDILTVTGDTDPSNGTVTVNADGSFTYTPDPDFNGSDLFTYDVSDGIETVTATVNITVNPINDLPVADAGLDQTVTIGDNVVLDGSISSDPVEGDLISYAWSIISAPGGSTATLNNADTVNPDFDPDVVGAYTVQLIVNDGTDDSVADTVEITVEDLPNTAPTAVDDDYTTDEDSALVVAVPGVLENDSDIDGDILTVTGDTDPSNGTVTVNADGSFTYTPDPDFNGSDLFTYDVSDGIETVTATVNITVNPINDLPVADAGLDQTVTIGDNVVLDGSISSDPVEGDLISYAWSIISAPGGSTATLNNADTVGPDFDPDLVGAYTVQLTVNDGSDDSAADTVEIFVEDLPNTAPTAINDDYTTDEDVALVIAALGVLDNDSDIDGDALTVIGNTDPSNGSVTVNADGSFTYTPDPDFNGSDSFTYDVSDGIEIETATVNIMVDPINDVPVADAGLDQTVTIGDNVVLDGSASSDPVEGDLISYAWSIISAPESSVATLDNADTVNPDFDPDLVGAYTVQLIVNDGTDDSAADTVEITVEDLPNTAPTAVDDDYTTDEDVALVVAAPGVLDNDSDIDGDALTVTANTDPANGSVTVNTDGSFTYTPDPDFNGSDSFTYDVSDGIETETASVNITVDPINDVPVADAGLNQTVTIGDNVVLDGSASSDSVEGDLISYAWSIIAAPAGSAATLNNADIVSPDFDPDVVGAYTVQLIVNDGTDDSAADTVEITVEDLPNTAPTAVDDDYTTDEDVALVVAAPGVLDNDSDIDGDALTVTANTDPANGSVTVNTDGSFTYTPDPDFNGSDSFTYDVSDGIETETATVNISVDPINDVPVAVDDTTYSTDEDVALVIAAPGVLDNDSDIDGDALTVTGNTDPSNGSVTVNADGSFTYTPDPDFNGSDSFTYDVSDGIETVTATANITVNPVNDLPVADADLDQTVTIGDNVVLDGSASSDPIEGDLISYAWSIISAPVDSAATLNNADTVNPDFDPDLVGDYVVQLIVNDGTDDSAADTVEIFVEDLPNTAPTAINDDYTTDEDVALVIAALGVLDNDSDIDGDALTVTGNTDPSNGSVTVNADGSFTYTPDPDFNGSDSFTYDVSDGIETETATVNITVDPINDVPVADAGLNQTVTIGDNVVLDGSASSDPVEGDLITYAWSIISAPAGSAATLNNADNVNPDFDPDLVGDYVVQLIVNDGTDDSAADTVEIFVEDLPNTAPTAINDDYTTDEDVALVVAALGVLDNDSDVDGDALTITGNTDPSNGSVAINTDGSFTYTADPDFNGSDSFTYDVSDGIETVTATVNITVDPINDVPTAVEDDYSTDEDVALVIAAPSVLDNDSDIDGDALTVTGNTDPANGSVTVNADGSFTYTPDPDFNGSDSFTYDVSDAIETETATVNITVDPINDVPTAVEDDYSTDEDVALVISVPGVLDNDSDLDGDALTVTGNTDPSNGTVAVNADGSFTYTPDPDFNGSDSFTYDVSDGIETATATVNITVDPINDLPVADAGLDQTVTIGDNVVLDASASSDPIEGDLISYAWSIISAPESSVATLDNADTVNPDFDPDLVGAYTVQLIVNDGTDDSAADTVEITVEDLPNTAPTAVDDDYTTDEDVALVVAAPGVLDNDSDIDGDALTVTANTDPANGSVTVNTDGSFTYTPDPDFNGSDSFTYDVSDGIETETASVNITVDPINDVPVADAGLNQTVTIGDNVVLDGSASSDSVEGDLISYAWSIIAAPAGSAATLNNADIVSPDFDPDVVGAYTVQLIVNDGTDDSAADTVEITVEDLPNTAPTAVDDDYTTDEDVALVVAAPGVLDNDSDIDGDALTVTANTDPANGSVTVNTDGSFTYTPDPDFNGSDSFTYDVSDGIETVTATVNITINPIGDSAPEFAVIGPFSVDENSVVDTLIGTVTATDDDLDVLTFSEVVDGSGESVFSIDSGTGEITVEDPSALDREALESFLYEIQVSDGVFKTPATVTINLLGVNDNLPEADSQSLVTDEDQPLVVTLYGDDLDIGPSDVLVFTIDGAPVNGVLSDLTVLTDDSASITYTPNLNFNGSDSFTFTVFDGDNTSLVGTVSITVRAVNDVPVADSQDLATAEDTSIEVTLNGTDEDGQALIFLIDSAPSNGSLSGITPTSDTTATVTYSPDPDFVGSDVFTFLASDGVAISAAGTINITISADENDAPVITFNGPFYIDENSPVGTVIGSITAFDADLDALVFTEVLGGSGESVFSISSNGEITVEDQSALDRETIAVVTYEVQVTDGVDSDSASVLVFLNGVNDNAPTVDDQSLRTRRNTEIVITLTASDLDIDPTEELTFEIVDGPVNGTISEIVWIDENTVQITYTPDSGFQGDDSFTFTASDGTNTSELGTISVRVRGGPQN